MIPSWLRKGNLRKYVGAAGVTLGVVGVALAVDTYNFEWDTQYLTGEWDEDKWIASQGAPQYPNGSAHNVRIEGNEGTPRTISLIDADVGHITLAFDELTFDSVDAGGNTISINGVVTLTATGDDDWLEIIVEDNAALDSAG